MERRPRSQSPGRARRSRSRSRTPQQPDPAEWLPRAGIELQLQLQNDALVRAARLIRELRTSIEELQATVADLRARDRSTVDWLQRLTHRVAALELDVYGRSGSVPNTPPESPDWRGPDR